MKSSRPVSRIFRDRFRRHRGSARDRPGRRRESHSFEPLEARFLLSGLAAFPLVDTTPLLPLPADVRSQLSEGPPDFSSLSGDATGLSVYRDDSYLLNAGNGKPAVQVDLIWPQGPDPTDGDLLVSDASGQVLYVLPLSGIDGIDAILPIPTSQGGMSNLEVSLQINRPGSDSSSSSTGTYRITLSWTQTTASMPVATQQPRSVPSFQAIGASPVPGVFLVTPFVGPTTERIAGPTAPQPTLTATKDLPAPGPSTVPGGPQDSTGSIGTGVPTTAPADPGQSRAGVLPTAPASTPSTPSSSASGSAPGTPAIPLPSTSVPLDVEGGRPTVVAPLPLSGSSPDGGIFAYGRATGSNDPVRPTLTIAPASDSLDGLDGLATSPGRRRSRGFAAPVPLEVPGNEPARVEPLELEMAQSHSATGEAFLPPLIIPPPRWVGRDSNRPTASRWPILHSRIRPRTTLAAVAFGSAGLFFGLVAPDCVTRLAACKEDRRWKRAAYGNPG